MGKCPHCSGPSRIFVHALGDKLHICADCGLVFRVSRPDQREMLKRHSTKKYSEHPYFDFGKVDDDNEDMFLYQLALKELEARLGRGARILDVGAGSGHFMTMAGGLFQVTGLEPSPFLYQCIKNQKQERIFNLPLEEFHGNEPFDAILLIDLIEHLADPKLGLQIASRLLRPGGLLFVATVDTQSLWYKLVPLVWRLPKQSDFARYALRRLFPPQHNWYFNRRVLAEQVEAAGFQTLKHKGYSFPLQRAQEGSAVVAGLRMLALLDRLVGRYAEQYLLARKRPTGAASGVTVRQVRKFWERNPLFSGESAQQEGTRAWFEEHETVYADDVFAGRPPSAIFTAGLEPDSRILDAGCGPGFWVRLLLRRGFKNVVACDLTERAAALTRRSLDIFGLQASVQVGDAQNLPYADQSFDHVNCQGVIHHTPDPGKCVQEFHRVLKRDGTLCLSVYYKNFLLRRPLLTRGLARLAKRFVKLSGRGREGLLESGDPREIVRMYDGADNPLGLAFTRGELETLLGERFAILATERWFFPARSLPFKLPRSLHGRLDRRFGFMIVVRARKLTKN